MSKLCKKEKCKYPVFGKEYCLYHQHLRPDRQVRPLRITPVKKVSSKRQITSLKDKRFFDSIWLTRAHYCEECNLPLGDDSHSSYFSHILSKGAHPAMRHDDRNINLLCPKHHREWETGRKSDMNIYIKNIETIQFLKSKYYGKDRETNS